jgi:hypothetical protein
MRRNPYGNVDIEEFVVVIDDDCNNNDVDAYLQNWSRLPNILLAADDEG